MASGCGREGRKGVGIGKEGEYLISIVIFTVIFIVIVIVTNKLI